MAFVNETLTEQDKAWFASFNFRSVFSTRDPIPAPRKWTIDRDRDAVLIGLEGQGFEGRDVPPTFMVLIWAGQVIHIQAFSRGEGSNEKGTEKWWRLTHIGIPKALERQAETVLQLIREALDARSTGFRRDIVKAVHIQLSTPRFM